MTVTGVGQMRGPMPSPVAAGPSTGRGKSSGLGTASLVVGLCSIPLAGLVSVAGPTAIALGVGALRRSRADARGRWGVITGAIGCLLTAVWIVVVVAVYADRLDNLLPQRGRWEPMTERDVAASEYATAYDAWTATHRSPDGFGGLLGAGTITAPCFTMADESWWISVVRLDTCDATSELSWETTDSSDGQRVVRFGAGGVGAIISVDAVPQAIAEEIAPGGTLDEVVAYTTDHLLPESGVGVSETWETTVDGERAVAIRLDVSELGIDGEVVYVTRAPHPYPQADNTEFFLVHVVNEAGWVYSIEDSMERFEETFTWS